MGAILFSFGVGPIQGFAVTLMIGIVSSLFTAIVVTRIVIDYLLAERRSERELRLTGAREARERGSL